MRRAWRPRSSAWVTTCDAGRGRGSGRAQEAGSGFCHHRLRWRASAAGGSGGSQSALTLPAHADRDVAFGTSRRRSSHAPGAMDFLQKPFAPRSWPEGRARAGNATREGRAPTGRGGGGSLLADAAEPYGFGEMVGRAPQMRALFETIGRWPGRRVSAYFGRNGHRQGTGGAACTPFQAGGRSVREVNCGSLTEPCSNRSCSA